MSSPFGRDFAKAARAFVDPLVAELQTRGLMHRASGVDHVCYRVADLARYERLKPELAARGTLLSEAYVNGRPIASYGLNEPIVLASGYEIDVVELPAPKAGTAYAEGFEHIEVVTPETLDSLQLAGGLVKFHAESLADMIKAEKRAVAARTPRRVAVLDFDDTLLASKEPFLRAFHRAYECHVGGSVSFDELRAKQRPTYPEFFANLEVTDAKMMRRVIELFVREWPAFAADCVRPVGIESTMSCLVSEGFELHVWTARDPWTTRSSLAAAGLASHVTAVHGFEGEGVSKPVPPTALKTACAGKRVFMLGDSRSDLAGATALGAEFVQAAWISAEPLPGVGPGRVAATPFEALRLLLTR